METLQIAQILADLNDLQNTDPKAASTLLSANKPPAPKSLKPNNSSLPEPPKFDKLGRRIVGPMVTTPNFSRANSNFSTGSGSSSGAATPVGAPDDDADVDVQRATTLMQLFEMRGRFKQMGDTGLLKSKERVDAVTARYAKRELEEREKIAKARHPGV